MSPGNLSRLTSSAASGCPRLTERYIAKLSILEDIDDLGYQLIDPHSRPYSAVDQVIDPADSPDNHFDLDIYFILVRFLVNQKK